MYSAFLNKNYLYVVAGNIHDKQKYGYIILNDLLTQGYKAVGLDINYKNEQEGMVVYKDLSELKIKPDVLVLVIKPEIGNSLLRQAVDLKIDKIWCQVGAFDEAIKRTAADYNINLVADGSCLMVLARQVK
ncbi:CoA-binding protein [Patescibacteria group bacterium]|nr:CoA-binding protein [Patescibacteria group bacterium]